MHIPTYQVDAFTDRLFSGNPAMVCLLKEALSDALMQTIAAEHNLPVTVFLWEEQGQFQLRWFTPENELPLCGHGSLAAGHIIFTQFRPELNAITLQYRSGNVQLRRSGEAVEFDFPVKEVERCDMSELLVQGLGAVPSEVYRYRDERILAIFSDDDAIQQLTPDVNVLARLGYEGVIVSAPGHSVDFVSRVFYPRKLMSEDAVTGAAHCILVPFWSSRFNKTQLEARQLSRRGGALSCQMQGDHITLRAKAVTYMVGMVAIDGYK